ncbi:MAG: C45 family peptidase [Planctomycetota bacterium]
MKAFAKIGARGYRTKTASNLRVLRTICLLIAIWCCGSWAANVEVVDQELNLNGQGYTVLRVWGSYYEMGYAHASVLGDYIVDGVNQTKAILGTGAYEGMRQVMAQAIWMPSTIENELDGMVDSLASTHPEAGIDKLALKVFNTLGDWAYACRSHMCWGRYVSAPIKTLATRRLDFGTLPDAYNHHMLCALDPNDGSPRWLNLAIPGFVVVATGLNEYGTIVSSHDYQSQITDRAAGRMSRLVAFRHALTFATDPDVSTHLDTVFVELQNYEIMTASFLNYYAPEGLGGVMVCNPNRADADFYYLRRPQPSWYHGEAVITTNDWTDGTFTPADEDFGADAYYNDESPKTQESHWDLLASSGGSWNYQMLSVAYRGRENMTIWADGRLDGIGRTPRFEYEWSELFDLHRCDLYIDGTVDFKDFSRLAQYWLQDESSVDIAPAPFKDGKVDLKDLAVFVEHWLWEE